MHVVACEVPIPEHPFISGRADQIVADQKGELMVVDIKSCSDWTLNKAREEEAPENYINQVQLYLHFFKLKRGYILFYGKHRGDIEEHEVIYDAALCARLIDEIEKFMKENVAKNVPPPPCFGGQWGCPVCYPSEGVKK
jgi:predicted phage-related endonuclease